MDKKSSWIFYFLIGNDDQHLLLMKLGTIFVPIHSIFHELFFVARLQETIFPNGSWERSVDRPLRV